MAGARAGSLRGRCAGRGPGNLRADRGRERRLLVRAWRDLADRREQDGDDSAEAGHRVSARGAYLRAARYYAIGYHPLYGAPIDPRLRVGFQNQSDAFDKAAALLDPPGEAIEIPYEGTTLPGWFFRPDDDRPSPAAAHCPPTATTPLCTRCTWHRRFPPSSGAGPACCSTGRARAGRCSNRAFTPPAPTGRTSCRPRCRCRLGAQGCRPWPRIALTGWSLADTLALRAASGEHRLAACIADPALYRDGRGHGAPAGGGRGAVEPPLRGLPGRVHGHAVPEIASRDHRQPARSTGR